MHARRNGATLIEVLVAIFVMAMGMIALLALFPLGALRMSQAIQDDRCALMANNAAAIVNAKRMRVDPEILVTRDLFGVATPNDPYANPIADPVNNPGFNGTRLNNPADPTQGNVPLDPDGPSFPVLVDPTGYLSLQVGVQRWAPANAPGVLSRRNVSFCDPTTAGSGAIARSSRLRWLSLLDDITFDSDTAAPYQMGSPSIIGPSTIERAYNYTWACLLQKPRLSEPAVIDCSVIVYRSRSTGLTNENALSEYVYDANPYAVVVSPKTSFDTTRNTVTIDYAASQPPPLRIGSWIFDVSYGPGWAAGSPAPHGWGYRVVAISDDPANQRMDVEVQQSLRGFPPNSINIPGTVLVLEGVVEVYERGPGRN